MTTTGTRPGPAFEEALTSLAATSRELLEPVLKMQPSGFFLQSLWRGYLACASHRVHCNGGTWSTEALQKANSEMGPAVRAVAARLHRLFTELPVQIKDDPEAQLKAVVRAIQVRGLSGVRSYTRTRQPRA